MEVSFIEKGLSDDRSPYSERVEPAADVSSEESLSTERSTFAEEDESLQIRRNKDGGQQKAVRDKIVEPRVVLQQLNSLKNLLKSIVVILHFLVYRSISLMWQVLRSCR